MTGLTVDPVFVDDVLHLTQLTPELEQAARDLGADPKLMLEAVTREGQRLVGFSAYWDRPYFWLQDTADHCALAPVGGPR